MGFIKVTPTYSEYGYGGALSFVATNSIAAIYSIDCKKQKEKIAALKAENTLSSLEWAAWCEYANAIIELTTDNVIYTVETVKNIMKLIDNCPDLVNQRLEDMARLHT